MNSEDFKNISSGCFHIVAILTLIVGGVWAVLQFNEKKKHQRIERSMHYVHALETNKVNEAIEFISNYWIEHHKNLPSKNKNIVEIVNNVHGYQFNIEIILNHLEEVAVCITHNICEETVVLKSKEGLFFAGFINHYSWILQQRKLTGHKTYHKTLECFIKQRYHSDKRVSKLKSFTCD